MVCVPLGLCQIPKQRRGHLGCAFSIAGHREGQDVTVGPVKFCGIEAVWVEERTLGIKAVAFPDQPDEGDETI